GPVTAPSSVQLRSDPPPGEDVLGRGQGGEDLRGHVLRVAARVLPAGIGRIADDDPPRHARHLVRQAVVVIYPRCRQRDLEAFVRQQEIAVPGLRARRDTPPPIEERGVVGGRGMAVPLVQVDEAEGRSGCDGKSARREPDAISALGSPHLDHLAGGGPDPGRHREGGERATPEGQTRTPRRCHFASRALASGSWKSTTWACGLSTPGWPAL